MKNCCMILTDSDWVLFTKQNCRVIARVAVYNAIINGKWGPIIIQIILFLFLFLLLFLIWSFIFELIFKLLFFLWFISTPRGFFMFSIWFDYFLLLFLIFFLFLVLLLLLLLFCFRSLIILPFTIITFIWYWHFSSGLYVLILLWRLRYFITLQFFRRSVWRDWF